MKWRIDGSQFHSYGSGGLCGFCRRAAPAAPVKASVHEPSYSYLAVVPVVPTKSKFKFKIKFKWIVSTNKWHILSAMPYQ